jgi:cation diffusion facilitator family transporter
MSEHMKDQRFKKAETAAWIGVFANLGLALMKGVIGFTSGSKALIADAANSASDVAGSFAVVIGLRAAKKPPDKDHPYGHGKAESIAAIIVSILLIVVGIQLILSSVKAIYAGVSYAPKSYAIIALLVSILVKEVLFQYKYRLGKKLSSQALIANAWDHRSDVYASSAAIIGVGGAVLGERLNQPWMLYMDPAIGIVVAIMVIRIGYRLVMDSIHSTMDHVLHEEDSAELVKTVLKSKGVITVDDLRAREHGHYVVVDLKISVNPRITVLEGHDIAKLVKHNLMNKFAHVSDVLVHVNPYDPGYPYKNQDNPEHNDIPNILH